MSFNITGDKREPKPFFVIRDNDESGVSGTGRVLDGVIWASGKVTINWRTVTPSIATYDSFEEFMDVHINPHPTNNTHVIFGNYYLDKKYKELKEKELILEEGYNKVFNDKLEDSLYVPDFEDEPQIPSVDLTGQFKKGH